MGKTQQNSYLTVVAGITSGSQPFLTGPRLEEGLAQGHHGECEGQSWAGALAAKCESVVSLLCPEGEPALSESASCSLSCRQSFASLGSFPGSKGMSSGGSLAMAHPHRSQGLYLYTLAQGHAPISAPRAPQKS